MAVFRHIKVEIPKSHVIVERQKGGKGALIKYVLSAVYNREKGYPEPKRVTIGHQSLDEPGKMHPTTQYAAIYPDRWEAVSKQSVRPALKRIGLHASCQAICRKTSLKAFLDDCYGSADSAALLDYALFSVLHHSSGNAEFSEKMRDEMLYSTQCPSDDWYAVLFEHRMKLGQSLEFRMRWAWHCREQGASQVWLCIDGSNDDCRIQGVEIAEKGDAAPDSNAGSVSFACAVTEEGLPVTFDVYEGGLADSKAMKNVMDFLLNFGFEVKGVMLDGGCFTKAAMEYLDEQKIPYIIKVKEGSTACADMVEAYGSRIKFNAGCLVADTFLFSVQQSTRLFRGSARTHCITLFYDYQKGCERVTAFLETYHAAMREACGIAAGGSSAIDTLGGMLMAVNVSRDGGPPEYRVGVDREAMQKTLDEKGLYCIISSETMTPAQIYALYASRDASEKQYTFIKTRLGYGVRQVRLAPGVHAKFLAAFIASIVRHEMEQAAKAVGKPTTRMIDEVDGLTMIKIGDSYACTHTEKQGVIDFFKCLGADCGEVLDEAVKTENERLSGKVLDLGHRRPASKMGSHRPVSASEGSTIRKKTGVAPGTKRGELNKDGSVRKRPGVAAGTRRGKFNKDGSLRKKPGPKAG